MTLQWKKTCNTMSILHNYHTTSEQTFDLTMSKVSLYTVHLSIIHDHHPRQTKASKQALHPAPPKLYIPENKQTTPYWLFSGLSPGLANMWTARHAQLSSYPCVCRTTAYSFGTQTWDRAWKRWEEPGAHELWLVTPKRGDCVMVWREMDTNARTE